MYPILFKIGGLTFYSHGLFIVLGIIAGAALVFLLAKRSDLDRSNFLDNIVYVALLGVLGARITYFILYPHQFSSLIQIIFLAGGGLVSYGGFILGAITFLVLLKMQKKPVLKWFDLLAIGLPLGLLFGRVGDFLAGDYGNLLLTGRSGVANWMLSNPLLEASLCFLIVLILLSISFFGKNRIKDGTILFLSVLIYSGGRFIIDFWRGDMPVLLGLSAGQIFSLIIFAVTLGIFILMQWRRKKGENYEFVS